MSARPTLREHALVMTGVLKDLADYWRHGILDDPEGTRLREIMERACEVSDITPSDKPRPARAFYKVEVAHPETRGTGAERWGVTIMVQGTYLDIRGTYRNRAVAEQTARKWCRHLSDQRAPRKTAKGVYESTGWKQA